MKNPNFYASAFKMLVDAVGNSQNDFNDIAELDGDGYWMSNEIDFLQKCANGDVTGEVRYNKETVHQVLSRFFQCANAAGWSLPWASADELLQAAEPNIIKGLAAAYKTAVMSYSHPITSLGDDVKQDVRSTLANNLEWMRQTGDSLNESDSLDDISDYINKYFCFCSDCNAVGLQPSF